MVSSTLGGWSYETFLRMTFHELVMLWYPRALAERRLQQEVRTLGVAAGIARSFGGGRK